MTELSNKPDYLPELDSWRAISVGLVIIAHLNQSGIFDLHTVFPFLKAFGSGQLGVDIFFFISGFVICRGLIVEEKKSGTISLKNFYIRRFFRIVPCLALYLVAITYLGSSGIIEHSGSQTLYAAAFVCNVPSVNCGWFAGHIWSLAFEEQFYLVFPALFLLLSGSRRSLFFAILCMGFIVLAFLKPILSWPGWINHGMTFSILVSGVLCAHFEAQLKNLASKIPFLLTPVIVLLLVAPYFSSPNKYISGLHFVSAHFCIAILVFKTLHAKGLVNSIFNGRALIYMGKTSYGIYLWQQLFTSGEYNVSWNYLLGFFTMALIVVFSYHLMEKPLIRFGAALVAKNTLRNQKMMTDSDPAID